MPFDRFLRHWQLSDRDIQAFIHYAAKKGHPFDREGWDEDRDYLLRQIKGEVAQRIYNGRAYLWQVLIGGDAVVDSALQHMSEADKLARTPSLPENG